MTEPQVKERVIQTKGNQVQTGIRLTESTGGLKSVELLMCASARRWDLRVQNMLLRLSKTETREAQVV